MALEKRAYPSLSSDGFITDPKLKLYFAFMMFISSQASQSNFYSGNISSFKYLLQAFPDNEEELLINTKRTLVSLLERYFKSVEVELEYTAKEDSDINKDNIVFMIEVIDDDNVKTDMEQTILVDNGKINTLNSHFNDLYK